MTPQDLERRRIVWQALSELYLDTELSSDQLKCITLICKRSGFSLKELKNINYYEVAPLLGRNLLSPAGVWSGFEPSWLLQGCEKNYHKRNQFLNSLRCHILNLLIIYSRRSNWNSIAINIKKPQLHK